MELSDEEGNFLKLVYIMFTVVPRHLCVYFVKKWDHKYPNEKWHNDIAKRNLKLGNLLKKRSGEQELNITSQKILKGDEEEWDTTTLISVLLDYGFNLIERCRPSSKRSIPLFESEEIEILRSIQTYFTHLSSFSLSLVEFKDKMSKIRTVAKNLFGEDVEREIYKVEVSPTTEIIRMEGKNLHEVFNSWKEDLAELKEKHATIDKLRERFQQLESKLSSLNAKIQHLQVGSIENNGSPKGANQIVEEISEEMKNTIPQLNIQEVEKEDIRVVERVCCSDMELSDEEGNFLKLVYIMFTVVPRHLSVYFVKKWDHKYPNEKWHNDVGKRDLKLGNLLKKRSGEQKLNITSQKILQGDEQEWDTTTLISALLDYGFNLIERCRPSSKRNIPLLESEEIEILRSIQTYFTHLSSFSLSLVEFNDKMTKIRNVAKNLFGEDVEREIYKVEVSPTTEIIRMEGKKLHEVFNTWKEDLAELKKKHATIDKLRERFQQLESKLSSLNAKIQHLQVCSIENKGSPKGANQNVEVIGEEMTNTIPQLNIQQVEKEDVDVAYPGNRETIE